MSMSKAFWRSFCRQWAAPSITRCRTLSLTSVLSPRKSTSFALGNSSRMPAKVCAPFASADEIFWPLKLSTPSSRSDLSGMCTLSLPVPTSIASMSRTESADRALKASLCGASTVRRYFLYMGSERTARVRRSMSSLVTAWSLRSRMRSSRSFHTLKLRESSLRMRNNLRSKASSTNLRKLASDSWCPVMSSTSKACGSALFFQVKPSISFAITAM
mmetsp:Transcript_49745/g.131231  ORF Transcript_49745/g.131231 Transcript_49745/m.131231 type:complete len:216 (-) Transcript_49745:862-1509(-)